MGQKYGQHFLHDQEVLSSLAELITTIATSHGTTTTLEIGPGKGALTKYLLKQPAKLLLSEIDTTLQAHLETLIAGTETTIIRGDVLRQPFVQKTADELLFAEQLLVPSQTLVVGNLPYYITSPILRLFFAQLSAFPAGVFLIQQEVAEKIRRDAKKKSYLRWLLNRTHRVCHAFVVKAGSFVPPPKVVSAVIVLEKMACNELEDRFQDRLLLFLDLASPFKRKTLGKIQKMHQEAFATAGLSIPASLLEKRLEALSRAEMRTILEADNLL